MPGQKLNRETVSIDSLANLNSEAYFQIANSGTLIYQHLKNSAQTYLSIPELAPISNSA